MPPPRDQRGVGWLVCFPLAFSMFGADRRPAVLPPLLLVLDGLRWCSVPHPRQEGSQARTGVLDRTLPRFQEVRPSLEVQRDRRRERTDRHIRLLEALPH